MNREDWNKIDSFICDKYYEVVTQYFVAKGLLIHYWNGNVDLIGQKGLYHIKYEDIELMRPIKPLKIQGLDIKIEGQIADETEISSIEKQG